MSSNALINRLDGYRRRIAHEYFMWNYRKRWRRNIRNYKAWAYKLRLTPPDVFLGPDLALGGVREHVRAIHKYAALNVQLVPDETAMGGLDNFTDDILEQFMKFEPAGPAVVHSHVMPWMIHWCRRQQDRGLCWIHSYHLPYFPEHGKNHLEPWQEEINDVLIHEARHADIRLSVSRWQQDYLRTEHGIETDYLPNGVDVAFCDQARAERFYCHYRVSAPFILFVGRNTPVKNPVDFVHLAEMLPTHTFVMLGHELSSNNLRRDWDSEPPPNLHVYGATSHAGVQDALAACAVLVVTSKREGLPTLVLEAMTQGKPVVVPNEAGCLEAISNGDFGFIYRQGDMEDLAKQTLAALADTIRCKNARQRVLQEYDWRVIAGKLDAIYRSCINR